MAKMKRKKKTPYRSGSMHLFWVCSATDEGCAIHSWKPDPNKDVGLVETYVMLTINIKESAPADATTCQDKGSSIGVGRGIARA